MESNTTISNSIAPWLNVPNSTQAIEFFDILPFLKEGDSYRSG